MPSTVNFADIDPVVEATTCCALEIDGAYHLADFEVWIDERTRICLCAAHTDQMLRGMNAYSEAVATPTGVARH
jgi:hypothetical protein